ncbi:hypothetical protein DL546_009838 [Coniochaeta pulveracea]|uniref:Uncharacterized protein n=1 Tax=Coniochaeta pulveracea TaxID=177199 RepID=A0A420YP83_9PEZI|nr:hypothetical protein DL546_009838 [Coniochaeta pulveracea]
MAVASHLDLNTLDNLSRTCRGVHHALLQFRRMLLISTLRCVNEDLEVNTDDVIRYRARISTTYSVNYPQRPVDQGMDKRHQHWVKAGQCARDLVSDCRRCGRVVCRNCAIKPPTPVVLRNRHRRLCKACGRAPLGLLAKPSLPPETTLNSEAMQRHICKCDSAEGIWLCQPCGRNLRSDDDGYKWPVTPCVLCEICCHKSMFLVQGFHPSSHRVFTHQSMVTSKSGVVGSNSTVADAISLKSDLFATSASTSAYQPLTSQPPFLLRPD